MQRPPGPARGGGTLGLCHTDTGTQMGGKGSPPHTQRSSQPQGAREEKQKVPPDQPLLEWESGSAQRRGSEVMSGFYSIS